MYKSLSERGLHPRCQKVPKAKCLEKPLFIIPVVSNKTSPWRVEWSTWPLPLGLARVPTSQTQYRMVQVLRTNLYIQSRVTLYMRAQLGVAAMAELLRGDKCDHCCRLCACSWLDTVRCTNPCASALTAHQLMSTGISAMGSSEDSWLRYASNLFPTVF